MPGIRTDKLQFIQRLIYFLFFRKFQVSVLWTKNMDNILSFFYYFLEGGWGGEIASTIPFSKVKLI